MKIKSEGTGTKLNFKIVAISVAILTVLTLRVSYAAIFSVQASTTIQQISTGKLNVTFDGAKMQVEDMYPKATAELPTAANSTGITGDYMTLSITNDGTLNGNYVGSVGFDTSSLPTGKTASDLVSPDYLVIGVYDVSSGEWISFGNKYYTTLSSLTATDGMYEILSGTIAKKLTVATTKQYRIYAWLAENTPTTQIGKLVYMKLDVTSTVGA